MNKQIVLVTGISGLLGLNLIDSLLLHGYFVVGVSRNSPHLIFDFSDPKYRSFIWESADIENFDSINRIFKKYPPYIVVHLAAQSIVSQANNSPESTVNVNVNGTLNLMNALKNLNYVNRVIIASSYRVYGNSTSFLCKESDSVSPISVYDKSKLQAEELAFSFYRIFDIPVIVTRCVNIFGPFDFNFTRLVPGVILAVLKQNPIMLRGDGRNRNSFIFVKDVVNAFLAIIKAPIENVSGAIFNIDSGNVFSVFEIANLIGSLNNKDFSISTFNEPAEMELQCFSNVDSSKIRTILDWHPVYNFEQSIINTYFWYKSVLN